MLAKLHFKRAKTKVAHKCLYIIIPLPYSYNEGKNLIFLVFLKDSF